MLRYLFISLLISLSLYGAEEKKEVLIVTSFYPIYISTLNIVDQVPGLKLVNLTKNTTGCLHDYQLTPQDMVTLSKADYFVVNGAGMESFLEKVIKTRKNLKVIEASKGIELLKDEHGENPHVWLSPSLALKQVRSISAALIKEFPDKKVFLETNAKEYGQKLEALKASMLKETSLLKTRSFVTFHEAFPYFAHEFNLKITDVIEREPGTEPSSRELVQIIQRLKKSPTKVIFAEPQYSAKSAETIARESGAKVFHLDPLVTGELKKEAYLEGMKKNLGVLKQALN